MQPLGAEYLCCSIGLIRVVAESAGASSPTASNVPPPEAFVTVRLPGERASPVTSGSNVTGTCNASSESIRAAACERAVRGPSAHGGRSGDPTR